MKNIAAMLVLVVFLVGGAFFLFGGLGDSALSKGTDDLVTLDGAEGYEDVNLEDHLGKGKKFILSFKAVPCSCCAFSIPYLNEMVEEGEYDIVTVAFSGKKKSIEKKFEEYGISYTWGLDLDQSIANKYGVTTSPTYVFFDEEGNHIGTSPYVEGTKEELAATYERFYEKAKGSQKEEG